MTDEFDYARSVADLLGSDRRSTFLAFLAQGFLLAGRALHPRTSEVDDATRTAGFASWNEATHVLGDQLGAVPGMRAVTQTLHSQKLYGASWLRSCAEPGRSFWFWTR
jgi:hypothetical protein